jgi:serine phosphatase RsbU (regulator of sigma subunit)
VTERRAEEIFATVTTVTVDLAAGAMTVRKCGHPPPLLIAGDRVQPVPGTPAMMLGVLPDLPSAPTTLPLPAGWVILVYTDGLIEGRVDGGDRRLGVAGLCALVSEYRLTGAPLAELPDWLFAQAEESNGDPLADDVAMLLLTRDGTQ